MHDQFTWAILKPQRNYFASMLRRLPILLGLVGAGMFWIMSVSKSINGPEKVVLLGFFLAILLAITASINHFWQTIGSASGTAVTKYQIDESMIVIDNKQQIPLKDINKNNAQKQIGEKLKPFAEWDQNHQANGQPYYLTLINGTTPVELKFATDFDLQHLLRSLKQYYESMDS